MCWTPPPAGTKTFTDLMFHWEQNRRVARGLPATDPALDLVYLAEGRPLAVVAHRRVAERLRPGTLILHNGAADPIVWFPGRFLHRAATGEPMRSPIALDEVDEVRGADRWKVMKSQFVVIEARAAGQAWTLAVPAFDVALVLTAMLLPGAEPK